MENVLSIDIETYSDVDLGKCGVYKYVQSDVFDILLFGYSVNHGIVKVVDLAKGEKLPDEIIEMILDGNTTKYAFNASFERVCLSSWLVKNGYFRGEYLDASSWRCTLVWSAYLGLPLSLEGAGKVLGLEEQKLKEGKDLIRYFCSPCKPTKSNGNRTRNLPVHDEQKWEQFKTYNKRDVEVELSIQDRLKNYPVPDHVWDEYHLDQKINDRGIFIDMEMVRQAIAFDEKSHQALLLEVQKLTMLDNPNSVMQMKAWLKEHGVELPSLGKKEVSEMIKIAPDEIKKVLVLRQSLAKSSIKKYQAMANAACKDNRACGMFQYYGANRSGRWAGRIIQLQNLPQNHMQDLNEARELVKQGNFIALDMLYESVPDTLSQLIRTAFIPKPGFKFIVADFSAIEARVISYLAGETWRNEVFKNDGDIYCASASEMFHVPVEKHGENAHLRQKGKIAELALGYGGSVGALKAMGALEMGLTEDELQPLVDSWRSANPRICEFWWSVDRAVKKCVKEKVNTSTHGISFYYQSAMLFIELPSKRRLAYVKPKMGINQFGSESVTYEGVGNTKKWERIESYGPKFVENIVQAISRDILAYAMKNLSNMRICGHVHDEVIIECPAHIKVEDVCALMGKTPPWISGLLLRADGYECSFYKKD